VNFWYIAIHGCIAYMVVNLLCVTADKFPQLSKNGLKGKAKLSLDEACHFSSCYLLWILSICANVVTEMCENDARMKNATERTTHLTWQSYTADFAPTA